jgi:hypothetical protein
MAAPPIGETAGMTTSCSEIRMYDEQRGRTGTTATARTSRDEYRLRITPRRDPGSRSTGVRRPDGCHPEEDFYAFALYTDDGAMTVCPAANSEQGHQQAAAESGETDPDELRYWRWATAEWPCKADGEDQFQAAYDLLNPDDRDDDDDEAFEELMVRLLDAMTDALGDLDEEGFFGTGAARDRVTLFVTISDSDLAEETENESAERLNPTSVFNRFAARWD